jgi:MFS transporter, PAT family, beta-lactamase induction signal transducer AmpG
MLAILLLGFASGLPAAQADKLLTFWLADSKLAPTTITPLIALASVPYGWKFLWSPLVDKYAPPLLGRRRGWIALTQITLVVLLLTLAAIEPAGAANTGFLGAIILSIGFVSATQDIAADAYRTDVLTDESERAGGAALWTNGFRISYLLAGGLMLLSGTLSWRGIYLLVAALMSIGIIATWFAPQPVDEGQAPATFADAVTRPFIDFFQRKGNIDASIILLFIFIYKIGDSLARVSANLYMKKAGFDNPTIGLQSSISMAAAIVGALFGAWVIARYHTHRALWIATILSALSILPYILLVQNGTADLPLLALAMNAESFFGGMEGAVFVVFLMGLCNSAYTATQYALFSGVLFFSKSIVVGYTGKIIENIGYLNLFWLAIACTIPALALLIYIAPWNQKPPMSPSIE